VVVHDLNFECVTVFPLEANPPLLVDPDAVLPSAITLEGLELIRGRNHEIPQLRRAIQVFQFLASSLLDLTVQALYELPTEDCLRILVLERTDHVLIVNPYVINVKR